MIGTEERTLLFTFLNSRIDKRLYIVYTNRN